ncbi:hypothetical protein UJ101_02551 [Flavobacteriaceae bacterium UJ101]|nr:hypothetical protein UJ101_02551 [Flavobacteriaceae bacterium UJ101]
MLDVYIKSNNQDSLIKAFYTIGEENLTEYIPLLLTETHDERISHNALFKGISVYQSKMLALEKISNLKSPCKLTYQYDSIIVNFYTNWAFNKDNFNKLIKNEFN